MKYPRYVSIIVGYEELFWLVVWNMFYFSISYMGCHPSHWRTYIFQRGRSTSNQHSCFHWIPQQIPWFLGVASIVSLSLHGEKKPIRFLRSTPHGPEFIPIDILITIVLGKL